MKDRNVILLPYQKKFIAVNSKIWNNKVPSVKKYFLMEGLLGGMPNHLIQLGTAANSIREKTDLYPLAVLLNHEKQSVEKMFRSFGIRDFAYLSDIPLSLVDIMAVVRQVIRVLFCGEINTVLQLEYKGLNIGHLIYDDILHEKNDCCTIEKVDKGIIVSVWKAMIYLRKYQRIITKYHIELTLLSHDTYILYGTLAAATVIKKGKLITVDDTEVSLYGNAEELYWNERCRKNIHKIISCSDRNFLIQKGKEHLGQKLNCDTGMMIDKLPFFNKRVYSRDELAAVCSHNNKKNVFIFMHVFSDAPHSSRMTMYRDYYDWIEDTLGYIVNIDKVNWYIKVHPHTFMYKENLVLEKINHIINESDHIFMVPEDFNTSSIMKAADAVVTCQGTVGIEAGCMGIPVVITGKPYYAGHGFTVEPRTKKEYQKCLEKIDRIKKLRDDKREEALMVMGAYAEYTFRDDTILDDEVYEHAGYGKKTDYRKAYDRIVKNMEGKMKEDIPLYHKVAEVAKQYLDSFMTQKQ